MASSEAWTRVFHKEIARRRALRGSNEAQMKKIWKQNPKGLLRAEDCKDHVWVPATHLSIHDGGSSKIVLDGIKTRSFTEAKPYKEEGVTVVPQMCWRCDETREYEIHIQSTEERLAELKANRPKKRKRIKHHIESSFDTLFSFE